MLFLFLRRCLGLLALVALTPLTAAATHIVGGELDLQHETGSTYTLTLNLYFDAVTGDPGALDPVMTAGIFEKATNARMADVALPLTSNTFVSYTNPACATGSLSTRKLVYRSTITLPAATYTSPAGYYVAVERCCRNVTITNIVNPGAAAQAFYLEFPAVVRNGQPFIDSTPRIFPPLSDYACRGETFYYDFGGQDPDGDSLAYDMVTPLNGHASSLIPAPAPSPGPYVPITWSAGRGTLNQIPGTPALAVNARTGRLTVQPSNLGLFVFGVRCSEYRRGVKIGETRRDFQLYVLNCPQNARPTLQVATGTGNTLYRPGRDTLRLVAGVGRCVRIRTTDPDPSTRLTVTTRAVNFTTTGPTFTTANTGTVRTAGAPDTLITSLCFPDCADTQGRVYLLDIMVADEGCSLPKRDTLRLAFTVTPSINNIPVLTSTFPAAPAASSSPVVVTLPRGGVYTATLTGTDADQDQLTLSGTAQGFNLAAAGMTFTAQSGPGQAAGTFRWQPGCGTAIAPGGQLVRFLLTETGPCVPQTREKTVLFRLVPTADTVAFELPNIITPNGDGLNDFFQFPTSTSDDLCDARFAEVRIFSRWGQQVYQSPERSFRWSGNGVAALYYYLVTYADGRRSKGWLQVAP
jgi:gliding motility-associated-like protein